MATLAWPFKDPEEVLDYTVDWRPRLGADTIVSTVFTIVSGEASTTLHMDSWSITGLDQMTTLWLSGGTLGVTYRILNHITTAAGRQMEQTVKLKVKAK